MNIIYFKLSQKKISEQNSLINSWSNLQYPVALDHVVFYMVHSQVLGIND